MPQMAPMNWTLLLITFSSLFTLIVIMLYFMFAYKPLTHPLKTNPFKTNWKW
uniref:ATP synthase F0 subunit 8 n=1 Tax=Curculionoidea sp. 28 KM-2017 TaxID=2219412 RepID=A0A346RJ66_9CUCU|nr:ATP synthase F0 subunit 8 [Curculionoidea sp. 28 KM-2017]